jgi:SAGA-associated factor 73
MTCYSHNIKRKTKQSNKVTLPSPHFQTTSLTPSTEAAIDANAPLEDEDAANGPVDSDEELAAVQQGLSKWDPQPLVPPVVQVPIQLHYRTQRLYEQLQSATNGFTVNICKVVGYGSQKLPNGHPGLNDGDGEADPDVDFGLTMGMTNIAARRASTFSMQLPPQRRPSSSSNRQ